MPSPRLQYALSLIGPGDWEDFEKYASEFLAVEYPALRTMASGSGDKGRDGELFAIPEEPSVGFQFSVSVDWKTKIRLTIKTLLEKRPNISRLIYVTNRVIGPAADELKEEVRRKDGISLDIRDSSYFVERELTYSQRQIASEELVKKFVDPLLTARRLIDQKGSPLSLNESRIALLHLALDDRDDDSGRGLTKSCFDSLTLAVLHDTNAGSPLSSVEVRNAVSARVPVGAPGQVEELVMSALSRLSKKGPIKHIKATDRYHLSFEESKALKDRTAGFLLDEVALEQEIHLHIRAADPELLLLSEEQAASAATALRGVLETVLFQRGEAFAMAVEDGSVYRLDATQLKDEIDGLNIKLPIPADRSVAVLMAVLDRPSERIQDHLRRLADAYTLFAFLRQTPDVQKVVLRIFSEGDIWLDTTAVLPLLAESLLDVDEDRHFTLLIRAASDAGLRLYVTDGVVEEIERHLNKAVAFSHTSYEEWNSSTPFIYSAFVLSGRSADGFVQWQRGICGRERPLQDVSDYLLDDFAIETKSLLDLSDAAPIELRGAVQDLWSESHERRRTRFDNDIDPAVLTRLVAHDVENAVGVIQYRRQMGTSPMGYRAWWLTLDRTALRLRAHLKDRLGNDAPASPVLSPDFLTQLLRLGPMRVAVEKNLRIHLPLISDISLMENLPKDFLAEAAKIRSQSTSTNERVIRREVRDGMDALSQKRGPHSLGGMDLIKERVTKKSAR
jgi:hypothetical protein